MLHHPLKLAAATLALSFFLIPSTARAQTLPSGLVQPLTQNNKIQRPPNLPIIQLFISRALDALALPDPDHVKAARDALVDGVVPPPGDPRLDKGYLDAYTQAFADAITDPTGKVRTSKLFQVQLNAAIVVAGIESKSPNAALESAISGYLSNNSNPVLTLWGLRAAKGVMQAKDANSPIATMIQPAVDSFRKAGQDTSGVYRAAYEALNVPTPNVAAQQAAFQKNVVQTMLTLYAQRAAQYDAAGDGVADDPAIEKTPQTFLTSINVWANLEPPQKQQIEKIMYEILVHLNNASPKVTSDKYEQIRDLAINIAQCFSVVGEEDNLTGLDNGVHGLSALAPPYTISPQQLMISINNCRPALDRAFGSLFDASEQSKKQMDPPSAPDSNPDAPADPNSPGAGFPPAPTPTAVDNSNVDPAQIIKASNNPAGNTPTPATLPVAGPPMPPPIPNNTPGQAGNPPMPGQQPQYPQGQSGQYPQGQPGQYPQGQPGQYPQGQAGQYPQGQPGPYPQYPQGQYPQGVYPPIQGQPYPPQFQRPVAPVQGQ